MKSKIKRYWKKIYQTIRKPEMTILPGQLAFFFVLSVIPLIALFGTIVALCGIDYESIVNLLESILPQAALELLLPIVSGKNINANMVIFYISAFLLASNGTHSMIIASNAIYKFKNKDYLFRRIKALIMTIVLVLLLLFVIVVPAFGDKIITAVTSFIGNNNISDNLVIIYNILKYPLSLILIYFCVKLLYVMAPDKTIKSKDTTYGSLFTTVGWVIATEVYSIYVDVFSRYNLFYGSLSNILILLLWVYILAYIFVFGMALNSGYINKEEKENKNEPKEAKSLSAS